MTFGQALLAVGQGIRHPLMVLSGNSVDDLIISLAAMTAGVLVAPVSGVAGRAGAARGPDRQLSTERAGVDTGWVRPFG